jgi:hypothetical protein
VKSGIEIQLSNDHAWITSAKANTFFEARIILSHSRASMLSIDQRSIKANTLRVSVSIKPLF